MSVLLLSAAPVAAAGLAPTYTDVSACAARNLGPDEFVRECAGPGGSGAILHYFDGRAIVVFGPAGRNGDVVDGGSANALDAPIDVSRSGDPFGPRIEWLGREGSSPCAATVRVRADGGDVLVSGPISSKGLAVSRSNDEARQAATAACGGAASRGGDAAEAADAGEPGRASTSLEGKGLSQCSQCSVPSLASLEGAGSSDAVATARLTRSDAVEHCRNHWGDENAEKVASCAEGEMAQIGGRTYRASADCVARTITATDGVSYRFAGMGEDYGGRAPTWTDLATGRLAETSRAGESATVTQQYATLCPGAFSDLGFDRFAD